MSILSDHIETFIKELMNEDGIMELQRNELANKFDCAPSQINYVLTTRFSPTRGYVIESRRGGGGYIRIIRLDIDRADYIMSIIESELMESINARRAIELVEGLWKTDFIDENAKDIILAAISDRALSIVPPEKKGEMRASILKEVLVRTI